MRFFSLFLFFFSASQLCVSWPVYRDDPFYFFFFIFAMTESIGKCKEPSAADEEKIVIFTDPIFFASTYVFIRTVEKKPIYWKHGRDLRPWPCPYVLIFSSISLAAARSTALVGFFSYFFFFFISPQTFSLREMPSEPIGPSKLLIPPEICTRLFSSFRTAFRLYKLSNAAAKKHKTKQRSPQVQR